MYTRNRSPNKALWPAVLALFLTACSGAVDASKSYSRAVINRGEIVPSENVRVHEYLNYYEQRFPEPQDGPLGLDLRLGNPWIPTVGGEVWLQVGVQARHAEEGIRTPLNLALVLDASGSMSDFDKMPYLKQSLRVFLHSLQPEDVVSIVAYSDQATVLRFAQMVGDGGWIQSTVDRLQPGGSTNLHAGMMAGFEEADRNFDIRRNNRVILLTDGIANRGVTNPEQIAAAALAYNQQGIFLSTIGLGLDMNDDLLSTLARQGHGAYHFVDSAQEMEKVFRNEAEGLVERVANDVKISIQPSNDVVLTTVSGYEGSAPKKGLKINLLDMGAGDSQVMMVRLEVLPGASGNRVLGTISLDYTDVFAQREKTIRREVTAKAETMGVYDPLIDVEVLRNATIVRMAEALKEIDLLFNQGQYEAAWRVAQGMEAELRSVAELAVDPQMVQDADLMQRYQITLEAALGYEPGEPVVPTTLPGSQPQRWGATPIPEDQLLPTIELE